jgi:isocitrate/isopropylmalate dehydrogenase
MSKVLILPGDGIGQEIVAQALKVIDYLNENHELNMALVHGLVGGSAYDETALPLPQATLDAAHECELRGFNELHSSIVYIHMRKLHTWVIFCHLNHGFSPKLTHF